MKLRALACAGLLLAGCKDHKVPGGPQPAGPQTAPGGPVTRELPAPRPAPDAAAAAGTAPILDLSGFAGFSEDGSSFAWVTHSVGAGVDILNVLDTATNQLRQTLPLAGGGLAEGETFVKSGRYQMKAVKPPAGLALVAHLEANPPTATLTLGDKRADAKLGDQPFPAGSTAAVWGASNDGKRVAVDITGKAPMGRGPFRAFRVVPVPGSAD